MQWGGLRGRVVELHRPERRKVPERAETAGSPEMRALSWWMLRTVLTWLCQTGMMGILKEVVTRLLTEQELYPPGCEFIRSSGAHLRASVHWFSLS